MKNKFNWKNLLNNFRWVLKKENSKSSNFTMIKKYKKCLFFIVHHSCFRQRTWKKFWAGTWRSLKRAWRWRRWPSCCTLLKRNFFSAFREKQRSASRRYWEIRRSGIIKNSLFFKIDKFTVSIYKWFNNPYRNVILKILKSLIHFVATYARLSSSLQLKSFLHYGCVCSIIKFLTTLWILAQQMKMKSLLPFFLLTTTKVILNVWFQNYNCQDRTQILVF